MKKLKSNFKYTKRYLRFSNYEIYFNRLKTKQIRFGYKYYQKLFRKYKTRGILRIHVRAPRVAIRRKTRFGRALEIRNKLSRSLGFLQASKFRRFVHRCQSQLSSVAKLASSWESRIDVIVSKTLLLPYSWITLQLIKSGNVFVNYKKIVQRSFCIPKNSFVHIYIPTYFFSSFAKIYKRRKMLKLLFWPATTGFESNFRTFTFLYMESPAISRIAYPFNFKIGYFSCLYPK